MPYGNSARLISRGMAVIERVYAIPQIHALMISFPVVQTVLFGSWFVGVIGLEQEQTWRNAKLLL